MPSRASFFDALFPDEYGACGVVLKAHTLGQAALLQRLGSPFAMAMHRPAQVVPNLGDNLLAAFVCSRSANQAKRQINSHRRFPPSYFRLWCWFKTRSRWPAAEADALALYEYMSASWPRPEFWKRNQLKGLKRGIEALHSLILVQRKHCGLTLAEALDVPVAVAIHDFYGHNEEEGEITLWSEDDYYIAENFDVIINRTKSNGQETRN